MIRVRKSDERGHFDYGWLETYHSFSFGHFYDEEHTSYRHLCVLNDDVVHPGQGFGTHGHQDMEIVTYVIRGALEHRDSTGTGSVLRAGGVQRMSAGRGITHSEFNASSDEALRLLQIWFRPRENGLDPGYEEMHVDPAQKTGGLRTLVAPGGGEDVLDIHQDVTVRAAILEPGTGLEYALPAGRGAWLQVATGALDLGELQLSQGDGAALENLGPLRIASEAGAEFVILEMG